MTRHLAGLSSFSVRFRDGYDVVQPSGQKIEFGESRSVALSRPDRLRVVITCRDPLGQPQFWASVVDWNTTPEFHKDRFRFTPPPKVRSR